jgi:probable HAF family extracellular repeat protein
VRHSIRFLPFVLALTAPPAAAQSWTPVNPDTTGAIAFGGVFAIDGSGRMAGFAQFAGGGGTQPATWDVLGSHQLPILLGDDEGLATGVNDAGDTVGVSVDYQDIGPLTYIFEHPVWWPTPSTAVDLRTLVTGGASLELKDCVDIDGQKRIIGHATLTGGAIGSRGYLFENGVITDLGTLNPGGYATVEVGAIAESGEVVGASTATTTFRHAFVWKNGVMTDLHDFAQMPGRNSHAYDVNAQGVIVGSGDFGADFLDYETGAMWDHGVITNLGSLAPGEYWAQAFAFGINDLKQVVGATNLPSGEARAFLWQNGAMTDLTTHLPPDSGWILTSAEDIDNEGRVVGQGLFQGSLMPFLLVPSCSGGFTPYAAGCPGSGGFTPALQGLGCPSAGQPAALDLTRGLGGAPGALLFGLGTGPLPLSPSCSLAVAPLSPLLVPFALSAGGPGQGAKFFLFTLASGTPPADVYAQAAVLDIGVPGLVSASNAVQVQIQ